MTLSGDIKLDLHGLWHWVLIPLLVDDPLRVYLMNELFTCVRVLIPLLVDDPLWDMKAKRWGTVRAVLIPLLVDDPLWEI